MGQKFMHLVAIMPSLVFSLPLSLSFTNFFPRSLTIYLARRMQFSGVREER